jgi:hypothetical protein
MPRPAPAASGLHHNCDAAETTPRGKPAPRYRIRGASATAAAVPQELAQMRSVLDVPPSRREGAFMMRKGFWAKAASLVAAIGTAAALAGCDTNYYGDSGTSRTTTTTTSAPAPLPPQSTSTTTVQPNPDGSVTTTQQNYQRY